MQQVPVRVLLLALDHFDVALAVVQQTRAPLGRPLLQLLVERLGEPWKLLHHSHASQSGSLTRRAIVCVSASRVPLT